MLDQLNIIRRLIDEHQKIRESMKLVGDQLSDREAVMALEREHGEWIPGRLEALPQKQERLVQTLSMLEEGLKNHYTFEEKVFSSLMGELLAEAFMLDHYELLQEITRVKAMVANTNLEGLSREETLSAQSHIQQAIDSIHQSKEEHTAIEEHILYMIESALRKRAKVA